MRCVVTGVAGFIGSHLAEALLEGGDQVVGLDCFTDYYARDAKERNLAGCREYDRFAFHQADLRHDDLRELVEGADVVFHLAGQPGVRRSWGSGFEDYVGCNILATNRLADAVRTAAGRARVVYASSSSIYGDADRYPTTEDAAARPRSPYGVSKFAGELLLRSYVDEFGLECVALRYFTVFGPRQRPDMAFARAMRAVITGEPFTVYGTGGQIRDFTYVSDVVAATCAAAGAPLPGPFLCANVAGGSSTSLDSVLDLIGEIAGRPVPLTHRGRATGDVERTGGDTTTARRVLGWAPGVSLRDALAGQWAWQKEVT